MTGAPLAVRGLVVSVCLAVLVGCGGGATTTRIVPRSTPSDTNVTIGYHRVLDLDFEKNPGAAGAPALDFAAYRTSAIAVDTLRFGATPLTYVADATGGHAVLFPGRVAIGKDRVVLRALTLTDPDPLSPGRADFAFGADVRLDDPGGADDGGSGMDRGVFSDTSQYKIQLDAHRPSCRIAGNEGEVTVKGTDVIEVGSWYRLRCQREGSTVVLTVAKLDASGNPLPAITWSDFRPTGSVAVQRTSTPLSIGGKIATDGGVVEDNTDQFNGAIDNIVFEVFGARSGDAITPAPRSSTSP